MSLHTSFAELLRHHRETQGLPLRAVADALHVDTSLVSKWERGERKPLREDLEKLATVLRCAARELELAWLRDAVVFAAGEDELALAAIKAAESQVAYNPLPKPVADRTIRLLKHLLTAEPRIKAAWLFGSFARHEARLGSDIDLMVEFHPGLRLSFFDTMGIQEHLSEALGRKVDMVEKGMLKDFAARTAERDMIPIHGEAHTA